MKVVLDANLLISGLAYPDSIPGRVVLAWRQGRFDLVISKEQLGEIGWVLSYPKIRRLLRWDDATIGTFLKQLLLRSELVEVEGGSSERLRDPGDQPILAALLAAEADCLVTGDQDLQALDDEYPVMSPAEFAKTL